MSTESYCGSDYQPSFLDVNSGVVDQQAVSFFHDEPKPTNLNYAYNSIVYDNLISNITENSKLLNQSATPIHQLTTLPDAKEQIYYRSHNEFIYKSEAIFHENKEVSNDSTLFARSSLSTKQISVLPLHHTPTTYVHPMNSVNVMGFTEMYNPMNISIRTNISPHLLENSRIKYDDQSVVTKRSEKTLKRSHFDTSTMSNGPLDPDARSRRNNMAYPKGTFLIRLSDFEASDNASSIWLVDNYQLLQKCVLDHTDSTGARYYSKTERYSGWLADEPWLYFPLSNIEILSDPANPQNQLVVLLLMPSSSEIDHHKEQSLSGKRSFKAEF